MLKILTTSLLVVLIANPLWSRVQVISSDEVESTSFLVAVVKGDSTLLPFAEYGNGGFYNPWPRINKPCPGCTYEIGPHSLGGMPQPWFEQGGKAPHEWYFRLSNGSPAVLKPLKTIEVVNHYEENWVVVTELPFEPEENSHHDNIGIAISTNLKIENFVKRKPEGDYFASSLKDGFDFLETLEIERIASEYPSGLELMFQFGLPNTAAERQKTNKTITKLYRSESVFDGEYLYFFEARKEYETRRPDGALSDHVSIYTGWAIVEDRPGGSWGILTSEIIFTDLDIKGPTLSLPLGILRLNGRVFIFVEEHGWDSESYTIFEFDGGIHRRLETDGG